MWFAAQILSKDSVTVAVDAVVYYRVYNATVSVTNIEDAHRSTRLLAQTTLRNVLGTKNLSEILSDRENISHFMQVRQRSKWAKCDDVLNIWVELGLDSLWRDWTLWRYGRGLLVRGLYSTAYSVGVSLRKG